MGAVETLLDGPLAWVTLSQPQSRNALSHQLVDELIAAFARLRSAPVRAVILWGAGGHFCAGAHLGELSESLHQREPQDATQLAALYATVLHCPHLTVAAVEGAAFGGGAGLAAACDFVVAAPGATWQFSELRLGFVPALISVFLPRRVRPARLLQLFLNPTPITAAQGVAEGLVDEVAENPRERARELALEVARKTAPSSLAACKKLLLELTLPNLDQQLARATLVNAAQRQQPDFREGLSYFLAQKTFRQWLSS